jgi:alpha-tubulin suppressor-like RCC1 family protein
VTAIDAGNHFTCAISAGAAKCFGHNFSGQLGDGTHQDRVAPTQVAGLTAGVTRISAGNAHACAVVGGGAKCWGNNFDGQLGDGTFAERTTPVNVVSLNSDVVAVSAGFNHSCALRQDGAVLCWGSNQFGQLGDETLTNRIVPSPVVGLGGPAVAVAAGSNTTCVLRGDGDVRCFGANDSNRLGIAAQLIRAVPRLVAGPSWASVDAGSTHTCGVSSAGAALCFGDNSQMQLGTGTPISRPLPAAVATLETGVVEVSAGWRHSCARTSVGAAVCWGQNLYGQLGDLTGPRPVPGPVPGLSSGVTDIDVGGDHSCAVTATGAALCWGANASGQLGDGTFVQRANPAPVEGLLSTVASIVSGQDHSCALRTTGGVKCWGSNAGGQLGNGGVAVTSNLPVDVVGLTSGATALAAGRFHSCAVTATGAVRCWGSNGAGQLGDGSTVTRPIPVAVAGLPATAVAVAAGDDHSCAVLANGSVHCWGASHLGQIGPNALQNSPTAVAVPIGAPAVSITAGSTHSCARLAGGGAACWGSTFHGQLGTGDAQLSPLPLDVLTGDFTTTTSLASTPNPSDGDDLVTLGVVVENADVTPEGFVRVFDGETPICAEYLAFGRARCLLHLTQGVHTLAASYVSTSGLLASEGSIQHLVNPVPGQTCAGFDDLDASHPMCPSVDWVRNRNVTLGCSAFHYCGAEVVNRLSMAAFMNRAGSVLSPAVDVASSQSVTVYAGFHQCMTPVLPAADHPRHVLVDVMITGMPIGGAGDVELRAVAERQFLFAAFGASSRGTAVAGQAMTLTASAAFDVPPDVGDFQFGLQASQPPGGLSYSLDGGCATRIVILNRNDTHAPYDAYP